MKSARASRKHGHQLPEGHWWHHVENYIMIGGVGSGFVVFFIYAIFVVPFERYENSEKQRITATNELARLRPTSGDAPYETLAKELADERKARIKAEGDAERNRRQGIAWLLASSNTSTVIPALDEAIAIVRHAASTNIRPQIATFVQSEIEAQGLEKTKAFEEDKQRAAQYFAMASYAISAYRERFVDPIARCGGTIEPLPNIPPVDWWVTRNGIKTNIVNTNCNLKFEVTFWTKADLNTIISIQGGKLASRAEFNLSNEPYFYSKLYLTNKLFTYKVRPPEQRENCIKDMDFILDLFFDSQKESLK